MKRIKVTVILILSVLLMICMPANTLAQGAPEKEEVVYVNLGCDGSVQDIYVVNAFDVTGEGTVTDYGRYSATRNMSTDEAIQTNGDMQSFTAPQGRFYYQGNMESKDMPWLITLEYALDGASISVGELAGKSGSLEIHMGIRQNTNVNSVFFEHYALQAAFTLDTETCSDIAADGATIADSGSDKLLTFTVLPGKEKDISIKANVRNFTMEGININGIPLNLDIDSPDTSGIKDEIKELQDGAVQLDDGAKEITDGVGDLSSGADKLYDAAKKLAGSSAQLKSGAGRIKDGIAALSAKSSSLVSGSAQVKAAIDSINAGLGQLSSFGSSLTQLTTGSAQFLSGLGDLANSMKTMPAASQAIYDAITQSRDALQAASAHDGDMNTVIAALSGSADPNVQALVSAYQQKSAVITNVGSGLGALAGQYGGFNTGVGQAAAAAQQLADSYKAINDNISRISLDGLNQLIAGIQQLKAQYGQLDASITEYTQGFAQIASGYGDVYAGIAGLADGLSSMEAGVKKFSGGAESLSAGARELSDGTGELRDRTSDMDTVVDDKVNEMVGEYTSDDYTLVSFASEKNTNIGLVQFVIKTDGISLPEDDTTAASAEPAQSQSFWDKLVGLF